MSPGLIVLILLSGAAALQPTDRPAAGAQLVAQAEREISAGNYTAAIRHAHEAATLFASAGDRVNQSVALNRVGQAALYAGDYVAAADAFREAAQLSSAAGDRENHAKQLSNLGNVHYFVGRYSEAARSYDEALALVEAAGAAGWTARWRRIVLVNKATLLQRLGREQDALEIYQALDDAQLPPDEQAQALVNRGVLYRRLGDPIKALATYDQARALFARARHVDGELGAMNNRAIVLALDLQQLDDAEQAFSDAAVVAERAGNRRELLHAYLYRGETRFRAGRIQPAHQDFVTALALARELKTPEEEWKALFGLGRSGQRGDAAEHHLLRSIEVIEQIRERIGIPSLRSDFFNDKTEVYDALIAARARTASAADVFNLLERSHARAWRDRLGLSQPLDLASIQRALPERVLLLDYWSSPRGAMLVAATRQRAGTVPVTIDETAIRTFVDQLSATDDKEWREASNLLGRAILPPAEWFEGIEHVVVVATGPLAFLPFELLSAGGEPLIRRATVSYTPTAATLINRPQGRRRRLLPPWSLELRAFGNPLKVDGETLTESSLSSSATEVKAVAAELEGGEVLHLGEDNRKAHLLQPSSAAPILHIASHASADSLAVERTRILFSPASGETEPDYLYLREVYDLPLGDVELAVLSACDTERGPVVRGEGVQSFSRAFLAAGARSTVTTLWRVADAPTASFMEVFYHHLQRGASRAEALRPAKLRFLESGSRLAHPHYWGAFILTGDGLRPVPRAVSWITVLAGIAAAAILLAAAILYLRSRRRDLSVTLPTGTHAGR